ncbi:hypothetical protein VNI00_012075 [Paramarasmius palmivorus]|uniref:Uncharacterized protein n=1 Tax=Paramarasmius palmivorus TaxID=297713 RepID=A0AAW0C8M5_9AGAR
MVTDMNKLNGGTENASDYRDVNGWNFQFNHVGQWGNGLCNGKVTQKGSQSSQEQFNNGCSGFGAYGYGGYQHQDNQFYNAWLYGDVLCFGTTQKHQFSHLDHGISQLKGT